MSTDQADIAHLKAALERSQAETIALVTAALGRDIQSPVEEPGSQAFLMRNMSPEIQEIARSFDEDARRFHNHIVELVTECREQRSRGMNPPARKMDPNWRAAYKTRYGDYPREDEMFKGYG